MVLKYNINYLNGAKVLHNMVKYPKSIQLRTAITNTSVHSKSLWRYLVIEKIKERNTKENSYQLVKVSPFYFIVSAFSVDTHNAMLEGVNNQS